MCRKGKEGGGEVWSTSRARDCVLEPFRASYCPLARDHCSVSLGPLKAVCNASRRAVVILMGYICRTPLARRAWYGIGYFHGSVPRHPLANSTSTPCYKPGQHDVFGSSMNHTP